MIPVKLVEQTPGFCGRLTKWILQTAIYPQPQLALGAALAATGTLKGHKVRSETDLRTNNLIIGIGLPSSGKGHGMACADMLFSEIGVEERVGGEPASDTALLSSLAEGKGVKLIQWDEIGLGLCKITSPKAPPYKANIINVVMQLFSCADRTFRGKQYANLDRKKDRVDIPQPCLNIYGVSTPTRFFEALNSDFGSDGFLSRLLVFESSLLHPKAATNPEPRYLSEALASQARAIFDEKVPDDENDLEPVAKPRTVRYGNRTRIAVGRLYEKYDTLKRQAETETLQSVHGRALEHIIKLSLTVEPKDEIGIDTIQWAEEVYDHLAGSLIHIINNNVSDSPFQRNLRKVFDLFKHGSLSRRDLTRRTQWLTPRERNEYIDTLVESNRIEEYRENIEGSFKPTRFYRPLA